MKPTIVDAISKLKPNVAFSVESEKIIAWDTSEVKTGESQPTQSEIDTELKKLQDEYDAKQYQRDREYPAMGEQLDMLFHDMTAGKGSKDGEWYKAVAKVKSDNPKPE